MNDTELRAHAAVLLFGYGITADEIAPVEGGWSAMAYKVTCAQGAFFLKVYDKNRHTLAAQLAKLSFCMSVSAWLAENTPLRGRINAPLPTTSGSITAETEAFTYLLFDFIDGVTPRKTPLTSAQHSELASIVGELHRHGADLPFDLASVRETFEIPCAGLEKMPQNSDGTLCVYRDRDLILRAIGVARELAAKVIATTPPFVLCHTDIHGWNLVQGDNLVLIDWESIRFAPPEADLYTFWGDLWDGYWDAFLAVYREFHHDFAVNEDALRFYQLRRHIEDIEEFYAKYLHDDLTEDTRREVIASLERECAFLATLVS